MIRWIEFFLSHVLANCTLFRQNSLRLDYKQLAMLKRSLMFYGLTYKHQCVSKFCFLFNLFEVS